jgi:hypothetical protein
LGQCPKPGAEQLVLHAELADALHGCGELAVGRVGPAFLERLFERGLGLPAPLLQLEDRQAELAGKRFHGLAAHQAQHHLALAPGAPAPASCEWARLQRALCWRDALACGLRGRAAPAPDAHRPIDRISAFDSVHAGLHHAGLRSDKWLSKETGCSSLTGTAK